MKSLPIKNFCFLSLTTAVLCGDVPSNWPSYYPEWWYDADPSESVIDVSKLGSGGQHGEEGSFSPILLGQLKFFVSKARDELDQQLASIGGAGPDIDAIVNAWEADPVSSSNFSAANLGQLKNVTYFFYERFAFIGFGPDSSGWPTSGDGFTPLPLQAASMIWGADPTVMVYPWSTNVGPVNESIALIGQAKYLFSWSLRTWTSIDDDGDGIPDYWELYYFGNLSENSPDSDYDGDGFSNALEFWFGTNPKDANGFPGATSPGSLMPGGDEDSDSYINEIDADPYDPEVGALAISINSISIN